MCRFFTVASGCHQSLLSSSPHSAVFSLSVEISLVIAEAALMTVHHTTLAELSWPSSVNMQEFVFYSGAAEQWEWRLIATDQFKREANTTGSINVIAAVFMNVNKQMCMKLKKMFFYFPDNGNIPLSCLIAVVTVHSGTAGNAEWFYIKKRKKENYINNCCKHTFHEYYTETTELLWN